MNTLPNVGEIDGGLLTIAWVLDGSILPIEHLPSVGTAP